MKKPLVYVAGPITKPDPLTNTHSGIMCATMLLDTGLIVPFSPHLTAFWEVIQPRPYEDWMQYDFEIIHRCDALYRMSGESAGADREVELASTLGIPVFNEEVHTEGRALRRLLEWAKTWSERD